MKRHSKDSKIVNCQKCTFKSCTLIGLALHNKESHDVSVQKSVKKFSSEMKKKGIKTSKKTDEDQDKPEKSWFECRNCSFKSPTAINLMLHIKGVHKNEDFANMAKKNSEKKLANNVNISKKDDKVSSSSVESLKFNLKCPMCPFKTSTNIGLNCHITKKHKNMDEDTSISKVVLPDDDPSKNDPGEEQVEQSDNDKDKMINVKETEMENSNSAEVIF